MKIHSKHINDVITTVSLITTYTVFHGFADWSKLKGQDY